MSTSKTHSRAAQHAPPLKAGRDDSVPPFVGSLAPALLALLGYLLLAPSASGDKDGSELTLALALGGTLHATGYPVFTVVGHLFVVAVHGLGATWAWAANAWSAVGGAVAILFLHALGTRLIPPSAAMGRWTRFGVALLPVTLFGLDPLWTYETTLAEVYSWHVAWAAACAWHFVGLARDAAAPGGTWDRRRAARTAAGWGLLCGLGGAHHATALFVAAPLSLALAGIGWRRGRVGLRECAIVLGAAVLPLASYAFVAYRAFHPAAWGWPALTPDWGSVLDHVTGAAYRHFLGHYNPSSEQAPLIARYIYPLLGGGLAMVGVAIAIARRGNRAVLGALAAAALLSTAYAFSYGVPDPASYFLAPLALALVAGCVGLGSELVVRGPAACRAARAAGLALSVATAVLAVQWGDLAARRRALYPAFEQRVRDMWGAIPFERAIVLWSSDMYARLREYQLLRGEKPGVDVLHPRMLAEPPVRAAFRARHGFDPFEGLVVSQADWAAANTDLALADAIRDDMARAINARTPLPVIIFDPERDSVRLVRKP